MFGGDRMLKKFITILSVLFVHNICFATIFSPLTFDKQVEEATSGVEVKLNNSHVFRNASGLIMTEYNFDVLESYNLSPDDLDNQKLKLTMPGGTLDGITSNIDGAPQFNSDDRSFLLLKKIESKIYLSNFTLGKYKIQEYEGKTDYVSEVFPMDPKVGRISKDNMIDLMKIKWKISSSSSLEQINSSMVPHVEKKLVLENSKNPEFKKRSPADDDNESVAHEEVPLFFWSAIALVVFFFSFIFFKLGKSGSE